MTSSPDLIHELRASRPSAPLELRARVREIAAAQPKTAPWASWRFPLRRGVLVAVPAVAALAFATAGVLGLARSDAPQGSAARADQAEKTMLESATTPPSTLPQQDTGGSITGADREQRISATLTVEVSDSDAVSRAAQEALDLTRSLGGYVVSSSVATGDVGQASITVRVPVGKVQEALTGLSGLGRIVSQQVTIDDLQQTLDELEKREAKVRSEIARIRARLQTEELDAQTEAVLRAKLQTLRAELTELRAGISSTEAEARMSTIQLTVVTEGATGAVATPSRIDRAIDEALNVLAWEGVIALGLLIVLAPFALVALAAWLGHRLYRRHEEERLLAT
jgi:nucleotide-binding universal stress UspA family protein